MSSVTEEADKQRWRIIKNKVFGAEKLTSQQQAAAWMQLTEKDLSYVERLLDVEPEELVEVLRCASAGKQFLSACK